MVCEWSVVFVVLSFFFFLFTASSEWFAVGCVFGLLLASSLRLCGCWCRDVLSCIAGAPYVGTVFMCPPHGEMPLFVIPPSTHHIITLWPIAHQPFIIIPNEAPCRQGRVPHTAVLFILPTTAICE